MPYLLRVKSNTAQFISSNAFITEEVVENADSARLIPKYNADAIDPGDVYALHNIIPEAEFNALTISALATAKRPERLPLLPYRHSKWVNQHLDLVFSAPKPNRKNL